MPTEYKPPSCNVSCISRIPSSESSTTRICVNIPPPPDWSPEKELQLGSHLVRQILVLRTSRHPHGSTTFTNRFFVLTIRIPDDEKHPAYHLETLSHRLASRRQAMRIAA